MLNDFRPFFDDDSGEDLITSPVFLKWCSPKVNKHMQILCDQYNDNSQGIVFVDQRHVASCLASIQSRIPTLDATFKAGQLVGQGLVRRLLRRPWPSGSNRTR